MPLNRTTIRALAASAAMLTAGGTVAAAAVFHLPVLGFGAAGAGASSVHPGQVAMVHTEAKAVAPVRVIKTRVVDQIVHHRAVAASTPAPRKAASVPAFVPSSVNSTSGTTVGSPTMAQPRRVPGGDDGHDSGDATEIEHDGDGDQSGGDAVSSPGSEPADGGIQVGQ